ncbi:MAG: hypothetical protein IT435_11830 [Phycisphaerales bacterium]|nr:hypothetical protein [Phycisphaerales bacterium]
MSHEKILHNEREAANRLGVPASWLRREADADRVPCLRVGRRRMFDLEAVRLALIERAKREAVARG